MRPVGTWFYFSLSLWPTSGASQHSYTHDTPCAFGFSSVYLRGVRSSWNYLHVVRAHLPAEQCSVAYHVGLRRSLWHGVMCASGLCGDWLVYITPLCFLFDRSSESFTLSCYRLISASVSTVIYYAFYCQPTVCSFYLSLCVLMGVLGSVLPFARWFNERHNKACFSTFSVRRFSYLFSDVQNFRVLFFVAMAFTAVAPLAHLCYAYSLRQMHEFISESSSPSVPWSTSTDPQILAAGPIYPSLLSYIVGLVFYVTHFPERYFHLNDRLSRWTDWLGGGSHAIWHLCIVIGIYTHLWGITEMKTLSQQMCGSSTAWMIHRDLFYLTGYI